jgi:hypothetical protein
LLGPHGQNGILDLVGFAGVGREGRTPAGVVAGYDLRDQIGAGGLDEPRERNVQRVSVGGRFVRDGAPEERQDLRERRDGGGRLRIEQKHMAPHAAGARHLWGRPGPEKGVSSRLRQRQSGQIAVPFAEASSAGEVARGAEKVKVLGRQAHGRRDLSMAFGVAEQSLVDAIARGGVQTGDSKSANQSKGRVMSCSATSGPTMRIRLLAGTTTSSFSRSGPDHPLS